MPRSISLVLRRVSFTWIVLTLLPAIAGADSIDAQRLKLIPARMQEFVADGSISGAVYLVAYRGRVLVLGAVGSSDIENRKPMRTDTIVQIMSQTKLFTGVAAMMLVEDGKLDLTRPVQDYLPEFKGQAHRGKTARWLHFHPPARTSHDGLAIDVSHIRLTLSAA